MQDPAIRTRIAAMGTTLGPDILDACTALFDAEQRTLQAALPAHATNIAYGPDPRHRLDLYRPAGDGPFPILVFVHGGGFLMGDKGDDGRWQNAAVGRLAAQRGFLGVVINYRLAPDHGWPAGSEDVLSTLDWLRTHSAAHGGDANRIILSGTSAGAVHCAGAVRLNPSIGVRGLVLLSGLYGYTPLDPRDERYYGPAADYSQRMPRGAIEATSLPLLLCCAEFDPPRFQQEFVGLVAARLASNGALPRAYIASGHNHYTMAMHLGSRDTRLADEVFAFAQHNAA